MSRHAAMRVQTLEGQLAMLHAAGDSHARLLACHCTEKSAFDEYFFDDIVHELCGHCLACIHVRILRMSPLRRASELLKLFQSIDPAERSPFHDVLLTETGCVLVTSTDPESHPFKSPLEKQLAKELADARTELTRLLAEEDNFDRRVDEANDLYLAGLSLDSGSYVPYNWLPHAQFYDSNY